MTVFYKKTIIFILLSTITFSVSAKMIIKLIKPGYYTDKVSTYYVITGYLSSHTDMFPSKRAEIEIVDKETIAELSPFDDRGELMEWDSFNDFFSKDHKNMIGQASTVAVKIPDFIVEHPDNLHIIDKDYAYYEKRVFYGHIELENVDFKSFEIIYSAYSKDKNKIFYSGKKIIKAKASHFMVIDRTYSKDDKHVYFKGEILSNANPEKFQKSGLFYRKDNNFVWNIDGSLISTNAETFKLVEKGKKNLKYDAYDKNHKYRNGVKIRK